MSSNPVEVGRALQFFKVVGQLKQLKRTGWVDHGALRIPLPESVADHMYRMSLLSFLVTDPSIDKNRLMKICLVHDLAESIVGDITPHAGVSKEEKRRLEEQALRSITSDLQYPDIAEEILDLWLDYEESRSKEAVIATQLDKLEMIIQADEYESLHPEKTLNSFFDSTMNVFHHPEVKAWAEELRSRRSQRLESSAVAGSSFSHDASTGDDRI
eukprot:scaffold4054_cov157-Ochromonas_danica.AAC.4